MRIVFLRVCCSICVRCSILILLIRTVRCSIPHCIINVWSGFIDSFTTKTQPHKPQFFITNRCDYPLHVSFPGAFIMYREVRWTCNCINYVTGNVGTKVILRRVRVTTVVMEKQQAMNIVCVCVCVCVCILILVTQHAKWIISTQRCTVICGLSGATIFSHVISLTARFSGKKKLLNTKCVFWFFLQLLSTTIPVLRSTQWHTAINVLYFGLHVKHRYNCQILMWLEFSWQFRKILRYQIS
jgi:hypothetical protein